MPKIFVSTAPFGEFDSTPLNLLNDTGWEYTVNPLDRKLTPQEVADYAEDVDGLIAGTEDIGIVLGKAKNLKIISRVGIGLDSVPLKVCKDRGITVSYTPDAVTMAVAEMTIGLMISASRHLMESDRHLRQRGWKRVQGKRIGESIIGLIGFGRVGKNVSR
ncbi:MAG: hydroxyacid dehydrogenase [Proteobacteria bacterium]|nr:hydroxyacid dehydrogenase [Pseudomonadota bacterium]